MYWDARQRWADYPASGPVTLEKRKLACWTCCTKTMHLLSLVHNSMELWGWLSPSLFVRKFKVHKLHEALLRPESQSLKTSWERKCWAVVQEQAPHMCPDICQNTHVEDSTNFKVVYLQPGDLWYNSISVGRVELIEVGDDISCYDMLWSFKIRDDKWLIMFSELLLKPLTVKLSLQTWIWRLLIQTLLNTICLDLNCRMVVTEIM